MHEVVAGCLQTATTEEPEEGVMKSKAGRYDSVLFCGEVNQVR